MPRTWYERVTFFAEVEGIEYEDAELLLAAGATFEGDDFEGPDDVERVCSLFDDGWDGWGSSVNEAG